MLNSMYSGISGLNANQRKLDVIGNNIANSGTTAFKASSITFQDSMYQTIRSASSPSLNLGGTNPSQVGLGVSVQGINVNMNQGSLQPTGRPLDLAIDQKGYFIVAKGPSEGSVPIDSANNVFDSKTTPKLAMSEIYYTRDGSFKLDTNGNLLNSNGLRIMGYAVTDVKDTAKKTAPGYDGNPTTTADLDMWYVKADDATAVEDKLVPLKIPESVRISATETKKVQSFSIEKDGMIRAVLSDGSTTALGQVAMASFNNEIGLEAQGQNLYLSSMNSGEPSVRPGKGATDEKLGDAYGDIVQGSLEMSNVDLAAQFTDMIIASRSFQANSKIITTGDEILQELVNLKR